jgi:hypothetical protein
LLSIMGSCRRLTKTISVPLSMSCYPNKILFPNC